MQFTKLFNLLLKYSVYNKRINDSIRQLSYSNTFRRILSGSFWNAILNLWGKGISFLGTVIIVRLIGREAFGEFGMLNSTIAMFGVFTTFSISQTATKYIAQYKNSDREKTGRIIGLSFLFSSLLGLLMFILVMIFADRIAISSLNAPHLTSSLRLMALGLLFGSLNGAQNGIISGFEAFKSNTLVSIFSSIALTVLKVALTYYYGFKGAVIGMTIEPIITYSITSFLTRNIIFSNNVQIRFRGAMSESKILLNYSLPSILTGLFVFPTYWYSMTLLAKSSLGYHELGAYNAANQWYNVLIFIPFILVSTFLPVFSDMLAKNQLKEVDRIIKNAILAIFLLFIPITLIFLIFGDTISLIYGHEFKGTGFLLAISVFSLLPQALSLVFSNLAGALNKMWVIFWVNVIWCFIYILLTYLFLNIGAIGLLWARLIAHTSNLVFMFLFYMQWKNKPIAIFK